MSIRVKRQKSAVKPGYVSLKVAQNQKMTTEAFIDHVVEATSLTEAEVRGVFSHLKNYLIKQLAQGNSVDIEQLGIWSVSVPGSWPETEIDLINAPHNQINVRVNFRPKPFLRQEVSARASFELQGGAERTPGIESVRSGQTGDPNKWKAGQNLIVRGKDIKFDPSDSTQGVFLRSIDGDERRVETYAVLTQGRAIFIVPPDLEGAGTLRLSVRIRYRRSKSSPPGELRETLYQTPLVETT